MLELHCDGASRGNPGDSGIGVVLVKGKRVIKEISRNIGRSTNNVAEYTSLVIGLSEALALNEKNIEVFMDSELVVKQILGEYRVRNHNLYVFYVITQSLAAKFSYFSISYKPRENNRLADFLAKKAVSALSRR